MARIVPFTDFFVEEALKKRSLHTLYNEDINKRCGQIHETPSRLAFNSAGGNVCPFEYSDPGFLAVYPSRKDSEEYLAKSEQLAEAMHGIGCQAVFEIRGNRKEIIAGFYAEQDDLKIVDSAVTNFYPNAITEQLEPDNQNSEYFVYDFIPQAPFYKAHSTFREFIISPLNQLVSMFRSIENNIGVYQVLFQPLPGHYHELVEEAIDCEWNAKHGMDNRTTPSIQSGAINRKLEYKSPDFKSYYSVGFRIMLPDSSMSEKVKAFISSYVYGERSYVILDSSHFSQEQISGIMNSRLTYHTGFLLNTHELTSIMHIPYQALEDKETKEIFAARPVGDIPSKTAEYEDVEIGNWECGRKGIAVHLPIQLEIPHVHIPGVSRMGKSVTLSHLAIRKFKKGEAVFVLDPHGDLVDNTLRMVPEELKEKVIVIDFGLEDYTPQFTIRHNVDISNPSKVSDDLTETMKEVGAERNRFFGPKMAYILQSLYYIYSVIPEMDLTHIRQLVTKTRKAKTMRTKVKARINHPIVRDFLDELEYMTQESVMPVVTILSHLLLDEKSLRLFTQETNQISIHDIMDNGKLCLVNLAVGIIGKQRSSIMSGIVDSLITNNALARASIPYHARKPCTIIKDEFYLGPGDLDSQLTGLAKYNLSLIFAHQYFDQVEGNTREVMATAGTKIAFKLRHKDAEKMGKDFGIDPEEFTSLKKFQAIVKIEDEVVKINTPRPEFPERDFSEEIKRLCLEKYYLRNAKPEPQQILTYDMI